MSARQCAKRRERRLPIIGIATGHTGLRTHRTLADAFGPGAKYHGLRSRRSTRLDRALGLSCLAAVCATVALLVWQVLR